MGIMVYSSLWVMQDLYQQPYYRVLRSGLGVGGAGTGGGRGELRNEARNSQLHEYTPL